MSKSTAKAKAPEGYILLNDFPGQIWSTAAIDIADDMGSEAEKRDPDVQNCYIYNDFLAYAICDLIEKELEKWSKMFKKDPKGMDTWIHLEGLTFFLAEFDDTITNIDDGSKFEALIQCWAAAWHTLASALHTSSPSLLTAEHRPSASNVLRTVACMAQDYNEIGDPVTEVGTALQVMLCREGLEWSDKPSRFEGGEDDEEEDEESEDDDDADTNLPKKRTKSAGQPPKKKQKNTMSRIEKLAAKTYAQAEKAIKTGDETTDFKWTTVWKRYKRKYFSMQEIKHGRGYDITAWPASIRAQYEFKNM